MNLTKTLGLAFLGSTLLFTSCKKDDDDTSNKTSNCTVKYALAYINGASTPADSIAYVVADNKVTRLNIDGGSLTFEYSGDRITKRNFIETGSTTPDAYDQITYNSDGTISRIESFENSSGTFRSYWRTDYTYTSGKISKMTDYDMSTGTADKQTEYTYTFTGNNITKVDITDFTVTPAESESYNFAYDSNNNYYKKQNTQAFLIDPFLGAGSDGLFLPIFFSANNVTAITIGTFSIPITYNLDDKQNLKDVSISSPAGQYKVNYNYLCQ
jgi:asparagine N-glycosylation enzyme membrane subunit Stt3